MSFQRSALAAVLLLWGSCCPGAEPLPRKRVEELRTLLRQDCGSCHGMTLRGGLGKPLTPEALKDKPVPALRQVILEGLPGTAMPPWKKLLSKEEAEVLARMIKGENP